MENVAQQLRIPGVDDPKRNAFDLLETWLRDTRNGKWLLILDNADDPRVLREPPSTMTGPSLDYASASAKACLDHIPVCDHGSILFTTRSTQAAIQVVDASDIIAVPPMDAQLARVLLQRKLGQKHEEGDMAELVHELEFMPLAITQAATYIRQRWPLCSVRQYLERLLKSDRSKMRLLDANSADLDRHHGSSRSILLTWRISFEHIRQLRPSAADLLSLMSLFDRQAIPASLLKERIAVELSGFAEESNQSTVTESGSFHSSDFRGKAEEDGCREESEHDDDEDKLEDDLATLLSYSFIAVTSNKGEFEMHRLVQLAAQAWLHDQGELSQWQMRLTVNLDKAFPIAVYPNWTLCQSLFPHVKLASSFGFKESPVSARWAALMYRAACYLQAIGIAGDAERMALLSAKARQAALGLEHEDTLSSMEMIALCQKDQGHLNDAESQQTVVSKSRDQVLGRKHPTSLTSASHLAAIYWHQGKWLEAMELEKQVLSTRECLLGMEHSDTVMSMEKLASMQRGQGLWTEAEKLEVHVITRRKSALGPEHPDTLMSMGNLGSTYRHQGRWSEAEKLEIHVMNRRKIVLGQEHPDTLMSMGNLASTFRHQGRLIEAEKLCVLVLRTSELVLGNDHPSTLKSMTNLASTYCCQERFTEAETLELQALKIRTKILAREHPCTLQSMSHLALIYRHQGRWAEAEHFGWQVMATRIRLLGEQHPVTLSCMDNLASTYRHQRRLVEADELGKYVLRTRSRTLGEEHPSTLTSMENVARTLKASGLEAEAFGLIQICATLSVKRLGQEHPRAVTRSRLRQHWIFEKAQEILPVKH